MISQVNFRKVENGYFMDYFEKGKDGSVAKQRVFLSWSALVEWMTAQMGEQDKK